jgi:hypothetical protein
MTNEKPRAGIPGLFASKEAEHLEQGTFTPLLEIPKPRPGSLGFGTTNKLSLSWGKEKLSTL